MKHRAHIIGLDVLFIIVVSYGIILFRMLDSLFVRAGIVFALLALYVFLSTQIAGLVLSNLKKNVEHKYGLVVCALGAAIGALAILAGIGAVLVGLIVRLGLENAIVGFSVLVLLGCVFAVLGIAVLLCFKYTQYRLLSGQSLKQAIQQSLRLAKQYKLYAQPIRFGLAAAFVFVVIHILVRIFLLNDIHGFVTIGPAYYFSRNLAIAVVAYMILFILRMRIARVTLLKRS